MTQVSPYYITELLISKFVSSLIPSDILDAFPGYHFLQNYLSNLNYQRLFDVQSLHNQCKEENVWINVSS